jgi:hypothetical protein
MPRRSISRRDEAERRYPWRVDVLVPELGLQQRLTAMLDWAEGRLDRDAWDQHGLTAGLTATGSPQDWARFYFLEEGAARAFQAAWGGHLAQQGIPGP